MRIFLHFQNQKTRSLAMSAIATFALLSCGGGGGSGAGGCSGNCSVTPPVASPTATLLTANEVKQVIAQAVAEAQAKGAKATIAVVDRVGNVLAVYRMTGAATSVAVRSGRDVLPGGLDGIPAGAIPDSDVAAAVAKAITGAYLSSEGNAFSTRTASQIVQEHFLPEERNAPSGPLYGVQFSQLTCSDLIRQPSDGTVGPKASPLGLSADPGGLPLYKNGTPVGGVGVISDGVYSLDLRITDIDDDQDELIAVAATHGFNAPTERRADRITADGRTFRFTDKESLATDPSKAPAFDSLAAALGAQISFGGFTAGTIQQGVAFNTPASGIRPANATGAEQAFAAIGASVLVDSANNNRYTPRDGTEASVDKLKANEVTRIVAEALMIANRARAQIRRPIGAAAEVTVSVVDSEGEVLGLARTKDAPVFGTDVSLQKARSALLFSHPQTGAQLRTLPAAKYAVPLPLFSQSSALGAYADRMRDFIGVEAGNLDGKFAYSTRAIGNLHRPTFPDGIDGTGAGPLSTNFDRWSPFDVGFQLDLVYNQFVRAIFGDTSIGCAGRKAANAPSGDPDLGLTRAKNGIQIFPGGVPIYRGQTLIGAIGVSGDGVDQDDMVAFLGLANASSALNTGFANAPSDRRSDKLSPQGTRLRYVQCPQAPFNGSTEQNVCAGL